MRLYRALILILFLFILFSISSKAEHITWTGAVSKSWSDPSNWTPNQIPTAEDTVFITNKYAVIYAGTNAVCWKLEIDSGHSVTINQGASLTVTNDSDEAGLSILGALYNKGILNISNVDEAIINAGTVINDSLLIITNTHGDAIENQTVGTFENNGQILMDTVYRGLDNKNDFFNNGSMRVQNVTSYGIYNRGNFENGLCSYLKTNGFQNSTSSITLNEGHMEWAERPLAISPVAPFTNDGVIQDQADSDSLTLSYISNSSGHIVTKIKEYIGEGSEVTGFLDGSSFSFLNDSIYTDRNLTHSAGRFNRLSLTWFVNEGAVGYDKFYYPIRIDRACTDTVEILSNAIALDCAGANTFTGAVSNQWNVSANWSLGHLPKSCESVYINGHDIIISNSQPAAARILFLQGAGDSLSIDVGGTLTIAYGLTGIEMSDSTALLNSGTITISDTKGDGISGSSMIFIQNLGNLSIARTGNNGIKLDDGTLKNQNIMTINNTEHNGIEINKGAFLSSNFASILNSGASGLRIKGKSFNNTGFLKIDGTMNWGAFLNSEEILNSGIFEIENIDGSIALMLIDSMDNSGSISIENSASIGLGNAKFLKNTGSINVTNSGFIDVLNGVDRFLKSKNNTKSLSTRFINQGNLTVTDSGDSSLFNDGFMYNDTCAIIEINGGMQNVRTINNYGTFIQDHPATNSTAGIFNNHGVVKDIQESFSDCVAISGCYNSTGLRFYKDLSNTLTVGYAYEDVLNETSTSVFLDSIWYLDPVLSDVAGTFSMAANQWTPNRDALGYQNFHAEIIFPGGACLDTISFDFSEVAIAPTCDSIVAIEGRRGFADWNSAVSWDLERLPEDCDDVHLFDHVDVELSAGDTAVCKTLFLESISTIEVDSSAILIIGQ